MTVFIQTTQSVGPPGAITNGDHTWPSWGCTGIDSVTVRDFKSLNEVISSHVPGEWDGGGSGGVGNKVNYIAWWLTYHRNNAQCHIDLGMFYLRLTVKVVVQILVGLLVVYGDMILVVHLYWPPSIRLSGVKERVAVRWIPCWNVGVSLSHLIFVAVTASDSSPIRSQVRE